VDIKSLSSQSGKIFLADVSRDFLNLEGKEVAVDDRAWVIVSRGTQSDQTKRVDLFGERESKYTVGASGAVASVGRVYSGNDERLKALEAYLTIKDVGNLDIDGVPVFAKLPLKDMGTKEFDAVWGGLPTEVAGALHLAVLKFNPQWEYSREGE
jgi:hypothetical protein